MALISLAGIAQAIDNLHLNETTLKARLLQAIARRFTDEESLDTLTAIPPQDLIHELWKPQGASETKARRKNLSSLKSSINKSLKEGIQSNANPDGIIIGRDNVFTIADEKKNLLLDKLAQAGGDSSALLSALSTLNEMLTGTSTPADQNEALKILDQLDATRQMLTRMAGLAGEENEVTASPSPQEDEQQLPVEELELDADTVIEFLDEEGPGDEAEAQAAGGASDPGGDASSADWDSFEVMDDDDLDVVELKEDLAAAAPQQQAEEEIPAPAGDGPASAQGDVGEAKDGDLEGVAAEAGSDPGGDSSPADWDSFEVMDDDDLDLVELEEDMAASAHQQITEEDIPAPAGDDPASAQGAVGEADEGDLEEVELEEDFEEPSSQEPAALEPGAGSAGGLGLEEEEAAGGGDNPAEAAAADWDSFEVVDDDDFEIRERTDLSGQTAKNEGREEMAAPGPEGPKPAMAQAMDFSQYIEAEEALDNNPDILQEQNDTYVRQILARFMPKSIKIPAGSYPVGGPKKRQTDRPTGRVALPQFYIGQLPITNDLFDFFVRETGYQTEAEQQGYGLVTSGRLSSGVQQKTGRPTLTITQGVISRPIKGANWRHPDGPDSSLDDRGHHPVVQVSRRDALAFAAWAGKRLPSEDEWEAAARGPAGLLFPWGNTFLPLANLAAHQRGSTTPVNYFGRQSLSPFGLLDMVGNIFEWTASNHKSPHGRQLAILKGGSWASTQVSCAHRLIEPAATWSNSIGFRCAVDGGQEQIDHKSG
ncbi:MAG: SUMF1/EgtB/PvdO family nonheme iron enzyme [Desulfurivibrionaceae bacterium]|nr:SUMF1/EgtB/PvdO family nonheme iron enzyme [Desulfurivibrionaceae bacterium]